MIKPRIVIKNLGKRYRRYDTDRPFTFMEAALSGGWRLTRPIDQFWAIRNICATVLPGEMLGVIGRNGAGKSTFLQLLGGVSTPDEGSVEITGKIGALLDLGASLSDDLTGEENILVNGVIAGLRRKQIKKLTQQIINFSELEEYIKFPVRTYSSGMRMRLAFSIAINSFPEILLVDEFLSVGDISFRSKCHRKIASLRQEGCSIVLVSHSNNLIAEKCNKAIWLEDGEIRMHGTAKTVVDEYISSINPVSPVICLEHQRNTTISEISSHQCKTDSTEVGDAQITEIELYPSNTIRPGSNLKVRIGFKSWRIIPEPIFSISITTEKGQKIISTNTLIARFKIDKIQEKGNIYISFERLELAPGKYFLSMGIYSKNWDTVYDYFWKKVEFCVLGNKSPYEGIVHSPISWQLTQ